MTQTLRDPFIPDQYFLPPAHPLIVCMKRPVWDARRKSPEAAIPAPGESTLSACGVPERMDGQRNSDRSDLHPRDG